MVSGQAVQVSADLTWTPTGPISRETFHETLPPPDRSVVRFGNLSRPVQATGSVTIGTTNYTPGASELASMTVLKTGSIGEAE